MKALSKCGYIVLVLLAATLCSCGPSKSVPDAKLDEIEAGMRTEAGYMFKVLQGDRQEVVSLVLAGLKRKPGDSIWCSLIQGCFAADRSDAKGLSPARRPAHYKRSLGYLRKAQRIMRSASLAAEDREDFQLGLNNLNGAIALASLESGDVDVARKNAEKMLVKNTDTSSWNYGNVINEANTILGRVALREGDTEAAKAYLLESADTTESPQLVSFGPSFLLARELLERGERDAVLQYLDAVATFWANPDDPKHRSEFSRGVARDHAAELERWRNEIKAGKIPNHRDWR